VRHDTVASRAAPPSYLQILRSTSLIGLSSVVSIALSVVRMKLLAALLGPAGVGLFGLYGLVVDFASSLAGMGAQSSGVRQVAEAAASGEVTRVSQTATVLWWVSVALGVVGAGMLALLAVPVSNLTFGRPVEAGGVALLGVAVFLRLMAGAPTALIQGTRRIGDLARLTVVGAVLNTVVTIPLVYFFGEGGIVPQKRGPSDVHSARDGHAGWAARTLCAALSERARAHRPRRGRCCAPGGGHPSRPTGSESRRRAARDHSLRRQPRSSCSHA